MMRVTDKLAVLQYRAVAARGAMLFFLLNSLNKIHAFYQYSLNAFVTVFSRAIDVAPGRLLFPASTVIASPAVMPAIWTTVHRECSVISCGSHNISLHLSQSSKELYNVHCSWTLCRKLARMYAGGRKKPVPKVTITELNRRVTGEAKDFDEVMAQARRVSQGGDM